VLAAACLCVCAGALPATAAAKGGKAKGPPPDLIVTSVKIGGVGDPEHVVIEPNGQPMGGFTVQIEVKNVGAGKAPESKAEIVGIFEDGKEMLGTVDVRALPAWSRHSKPAKETVDINHHFTHLGFMKIQAVANGVAPVHETVRAHRNNASKPVGHVAVIPQKWKVPEFDTLEKHPGFPLRETYPDSLSFTFSKYEHADEAYEYVVTGSVQGRIEGKFQGVCTISGHGVAAHTPWTSESAMLLYQSLTAYRGYVYASHEPKYDASFTCPGGPPIAAKEEFQDLVTEVSGSLKAPMKPTAKHIEDSTVYKEIEFYWQFDADIAGEPPPPPPPPPAA
jgi:hypothetical protein